MLQKLLRDQNTAKIRRPSRSFSEHQIFLDGFPPGGTVPQSMAGACSLAVRFGGKFRILRAAKTGKFMAEIALIFDLVMPVFRYPSISCTKIFLPTWIVPETVIYPHPCKGGSGAGDAAKTAVRQPFLGEVERMTQWALLIDGVALFYPKDDGQCILRWKSSPMMRMSIAQQCFALFDEGVKIVCTTAKQFRCRHGSTSAKNTP